MRNLKGVVILGLSAALLAASASSADARWSHRGYYGRGGYYGHGPGLVGVVVVGALTLATLPFAILGAATSPAPPPPPPPPPAYYGRGYGPSPYGYGPSPYGYGPPPPPAYYRGYGPPPGYGY
jgi:hypothetical protein